MMTLVQIRKKYPQYNNMSDVALLDALHSKYYSNLSQEDFFQRMGITPHHELSMRINEEYLHPALKSGEQFIKGVGAGLDQPVVEASNLLNKGILAIPGVKKVLPRGVQQEVLGQRTPPELGTGEAYNIGKPVGTSLSYLSMGPVGEATASSLEGAPMVGKIAEALGRTVGGRTLGRIAGATGFGAVEHPQSPLRGAETGVMYGAGAEALPAGAQLSGAGIEKLIGKVASPFSPKAYAAKILEHLSGGKNLEENAKSLAADIRNSYSTEMAASRRNYKAIFDKAGENNIYTDATDTVAPGEDMPRSYMNLDSEVTKNYPLSLKKAHNKFLKDTTLQNAHVLQNELGVTAYSNLKNPLLSLQDRGTLRGFLGARRTLRDDMKNYLSRADPTGNLGAAYQKASDHYASEVMPYKTTPKIGDISKGKVINPRNITNIFKNPEEDVQKIISDLGPQAAHKIVYNELGKVGRNPSGESLLNKANKLDARGLESYVMPSLDDQFELLRAKIARKNLTQKLGGGLVGMAITRPFAKDLISPGAAEFGGAMGGALAAPRILRGISDPISHSPITKMAAKSSFYDLLSKSLIANMLKGGK